MAAGLTTCTLGEVATFVRRILSVTPEDGLQPSGGASGVDGETRNAQTHQ